MTTPVVMQKVLDMAHLAQRLAQMPLSTEDLRSTWTRPEWEQIVEWWDEYINEARNITGLTYRNPKE